MSNASVCEALTFNNTATIEDDIRSDGIQETLMYNIIGGIFIAVVFLILKKIAWSKRGTDTCIYNANWISMYFGDAYYYIPEYELLRANSDYVSLDMKMSFFQMIKNIFYDISMEDISRRCGGDAEVYLSYLLCSTKYFFIETLLLCPTLPVNLNGVLLKDRSTFAKTTMGNLDFSENEWLWLHLFVAFVSSIACFYYIRAFSEIVASSFEHVVKTRVVRITDKRNRPMQSDEIEQFFSENLPYVEIEDVKLAYRYRRLCAIDSELKTAQQALDACEYISRLTGRTVYVIEKYWFFRFYCNCPFKQTKEEGMSYYRKESNRLQMMVYKELNKLSYKVLEFAFVTLTTWIQAKQVIHFFKDIEKSEDKESNWKAVRATEPGNIIWHNLRSESKGPNLKTYIINGTVFLLAFFLTTPGVILSSLNLRQFKKKIAPMFPALAVMLPPIIVLLLSVGVPALVTYSSQFLDFETKSTLCTSVMLKTVSFLICYIIVLPSLGLNSINTFMMAYVGGKEIRFECIFLPDRGNFYVRYVITYAFLGNLIRICKVPEMLYYFAQQLLWGKSEAERVAFRRNSLWEFTYGVDYGLSLTIYTLISFFSLACPLIAPFGFMYFGIKFVVDRYTIYCASSPSRTSSKVHIMTIKFMLFALCMKHFSITVLIIIRGGWLKINCATLLLFFSTIYACIGSLYPDLNLFPKWGLMPHKVKKEVQPEPDEQTKKYVTKLYQPYALQRYLPILANKDKFGNPLPKAQQFAIEAESKVKIGGFWKFVKENIFEDE